MPTYEYKCLDCEHRFEKVQRMSDDPLTECPTCDGKVKRLIGAGAGIIFKGSGFYETDYRSEGYKKQADKEKKGAEASTSSATKDSKSGGDSSSTSSTKSTEAS